MTDIIKIETSPEGVTLSQVGTKTYSIGDGDRLDMVFIPRDQVPALIKALQPIAHEIREIESL
jgi:hypothetical protein